MPQRALRYTPSKSTSLAKPQPAAKSQNRSVRSRNQPKEWVLTVDDLKSHAQEWLFDCQYRQHSKSTVDTRRLIVKNLIWFLERQKCEVVDATALKQFFHYMQRGHEEEGGRWGNALMSRPVRPRTIKDYHCHIRTLFRWMLAEEIIETSAMERIPAPISRADQVQPFTPEQVQALLGAAKQSQHPKRNTAILLLLLDTGMRATELCGLKMSDLDLLGQNCRILGKGNKHRTVYFGRNTAKNLTAYLRELAKKKPKGEVAPNSPLFISDGGTRTGEALTRSGVFTLVQRLGRAAGLNGVRCSPHTFRHTCAVEFLRSGGQVFSLRELYGHTSILQTQRYVTLAQADIENQQRLHSPADRLSKQK